MTIAKKLPEPLYERDFAAWSEEQVAYLRARRFDLLDIENIAEEIESSARSDRRAIRGHLMTLMLYMLKWQFQPRQRTKSWEQAMLTSRAEARKLLVKSPSLRRLVPGWVESEYRLARSNAAKEMGMPLTALPERPPFAIGEVLPYEE